MAKRDRAAYSRQWRAENPERAKELAQRTHYKRKYGITLEDYVEMYTSQGGRCLICGTLHEVLRVDHNHETGEVRGLLCHHCNVGIGYLQDSAELLTRAATYVLERGSYHKKSV